MALPRIVVTGALAALMAGCVSNTQPVPPCCYAGAVTTSRLASLQLSTDDGKRLRFAEVFPGFTPQEGLFATPLPFNEVEQHDIIYASLEPLLPIYDANGDGRLEKPEVVVLYAREAARATGTPVRHLGGETPIWAVSAPNADVGGLVSWAQQRRATMTEDGQTVFRDLERLGLDLATRGSEGGDPVGVVRVR
jgi:hypothetical protein